MRFSKVFLNLMFPGGIYRSREKNQKNMVIFQRSFALTGTSGQLYQAEVTIAETISVFIFCHSFPVSSFPISLLGNTLLWGRQGLIHSGQKYDSWPIPFPFAIFSFSYIELECI